MLKYFFSKHDARTKIFNTKVKTLLGFVLIKAKNYKYVEALCETIEQIVHPRRKVEVLCQELGR